MRQRSRRTPEVEGRVVQPVVPFVTGGNMKWAVLWDSPKKKAIIRHDCGPDLNEAVRIYQKVKSAGRANVTLLSANVGFPPPVKFQRTEWRNIGGKTKREERWVKVLVLMERANARGILWCPYCREFRRFGTQTHFYVEGRFARHPNKRGMLACPICGISHRDFHVRKWNPVAAEFYLRETRRKRGSRKA